MKMTPAQRNEKCREDEGTEEGGITGKWEKRRAREEEERAKRSRVVSEKQITG